MTGRGERGFDKLGLTLEITSLPSSEKLRNLSSWSQHMVYLRYILGYLRQDCDGCTMHTIDKRGGEMASTASFSPWRPYLGKVTP